MIVEDDNGEGGVEDCDDEDLSEIELICTRSYIQDGKRKVQQYLTKPNHCI